MKRSIITKSVTLLVFLTALPGSAQSPPFPINSYTPDAQSFPAVCADAAGNFVVVWESGAPDPTGGQDGSYIGIFGRRFLAGGGARGSEFAVNTYTTDYQTFPSIACDDGGGFIVAWSSFDQDGSSTGIFGQRFTNSGAPAGTEFQINEHTTGTQDYPAVGVAADGDFVVVWTSEIQDGRGFGVFGQRFTSSGAKTGIEFRVNSYTTGDQTYPAISVRDTGAFVVTWVSDGQDGDQGGIFAQRFSATALRDDSEFRVNTTTAGQQGYPAIAMDGDGRFIVVWSSGDVDDADIIGRRFASDGSPIGDEVLVNTYTTGTQIFPRVSAADTGELVVVWTSYGQEGNNAGVFGQRFASNGQRAGTEFQVNQSAAGDQYSAAPAQVSADDFVVVWATHEGAGDSSGTDIAGRWYSAATPTPTRTATAPPTATRTATRTSSPRPSATATVPQPTGTATVEPTEVPTETPVDTPTHTTTPEPSATPTEVDTPTIVAPSATPTPGVVGDCDGDGVVTVNELVIGVNIALDRAEMSRCAPFDRNDDGRVNVDELVAAVREALAA